MKDYPDYIVEAIQAQHDALMEIASVLADADRRKEAISQMQALLDLAQRTTRTIAKFKQELVIDDKDRISLIKSVLLDIKHLDDYNLDEL